MQVVTLTTKRRASKTIADGAANLYAWGTLSVTLAVVGEALNQEVHVTLSEAELRLALARIMARKQEIKEYNANVLNREN